MNIRPLRDLIFVVPDAKITQTESGILIPETAQEKPRSGIVKAVGPGLPGLPNETVPGDKVYFSRFAGDEVELDGVTYLILRERAEVHLIDSQ